MTSTDKSRLDRGRCQQGCLGPGTSERQEHTLPDHATKFRDIAAPDVTLPLMEQHSSTCGKEPAVEADCDGGSLQAGSMPQVAHAGLAEPYPNFASCSALSWARHIAIPGIVLVVGLLASFATILTAF